MSEEEPIDYEAVRQRFPWVGLEASGEHDLSVRYREIMGVDTFNIRVAHIHARSEGGPRWNPAMSEADNRSADTDVEIPVSGVKARPKAGPTGIGGVLGDSLLY